MDFEGFQDIDVTNAQQTEIQNRLINLNIEIGEYMDERPIGPLYPEQNALNIHFRSGLWDAISFLAQNTILIAVSIAIGGGGMIYYYESKKKTKIAF